MVGEAFYPFLQALLLSSDSAPKLHFTVTVIPEPKQMITHWVGPGQSSRDKTCACSNMLPTQDTWFFKLLLPIFDGVLLWDKHYLLLCCLLPNN